AGARPQQHDPAAGAAGLLALLGRAPVGVDLVAMIMRKTEVVALHLVHGQRPVRRVLRQRRRCDGHAQHERAQNDREFPHANVPWLVAGPAMDPSRLYIRIPARRGSCIARPAALPSSATRRLHMTSANTIVKQVVLKAPLERVWQAIADSERFGHWFGAEVDGAFAPGARLQARIRPTRVDPEIAKFQEPYDGVAF